MKFSTVRSLSLSLVLLVVAAPLFAQNAENLKTEAGTSVVKNLVGGSPVLGERLVMDNPVTYVARHCQKYESKPGFFGRVFSGKKAHLSDVGAEACANDASTVYSRQVVHNLRTTAGGDWQASVMGNTAAPPATCNFIALSNDATAPAAADTAVATEITVAGLARAQGTYAHTAGTASFTIQKVFNATATQASQKAGLLNASSAGTLCFENTYTQVTVNNGDTLTVTWTINY